MLTCLLLTACGSSAQDAGPVAWWHDLEGGPIAAQRPPPPNAHAPYPYLSSIPPKPKPIDPALQASTDAALTADRADASYEAARDPLQVTAPRAGNGLFAAAKPLPPPSADTAGAALDAATPSPAPPPTAARPPAAAPAHGPAVPNVDVPIPDIASDQTPLPPIPDAPPPPPVLPGVTIPVTAPAPAPKAPPPPPAAPAAFGAAEAAAVAIPFAPGSAVLSLAGQSALQALAARRGSHGVQVIGFGEADGLDPQSALAGVRLGVARARAIGASLLGDGVPIASLRLGADAPGRGAAARLVD